MSIAKDTINHLEKMYSFVRAKLDKDLPADIIISLIPNRGRSSYYGWFAKERWIEGEDRIHEINIASDYLNRSVDDIMETVIHECAHLKNCTLGIKDCTPTQYHNKKFKTQAEKYGLAVEKIRNKGYAQTSLGEDAQAIVDTYKKEFLKGSNPFKVYRKAQKKSILPSDKKQVAVDKDLAEDIMETSDFGSFTAAVDHILREWSTHGLRN
jgi:hypothetical protein